MADEIYCELYLMKSKDSDEYMLLYGYGQFHPSSCRPWDLDDKADRMPVSTARATLSRSDADALMMQFEGAASFPLQIARPKAQTLTIRGVERIRRPPVLRRPRMDSGAFDAAFGNRLCEVVELWNLDKDTLLTYLTADAASYREQAEHLHALIQLIASKVGRDFKARAYEALGNFELFTVRPHLYRWRQIPDRDGGARIGIAIEVDSGHPEVGERLSVAVSLENARITVHTSMREWRRDHPAVLEFRAAEPFSWAEVMIFGEAGELVDQARHGFLTSIESTGSLIAGRKIMRDDWSRQVEKRAGKANAARFGHVDRIDVVGHVMSTVIRDVDPREPWQAVSEERPPLFDVDVHSRDTYFLPKGPAEDEVTRFETIRSLFDAADVTLAICVDPYFNKKSLPLLARIRNRCPVEVVTRMKPPEMDEMLALLRQKPTLVTHPLKVLRPKRDFHDRFLVVERGSNRELFVLSNSYSPVVSEHPIVVVRASGVDALRILGYIADLREDAITHWPEEPAKPVSPPEVSEQGGAILAGILGGTTADLRALIFSMGAELWSLLGSYLATSPATSDAELVLEFLGAHSNPSHDFGALREAARRAAVATLQRTLESAITGFAVPHLLRHPSQTPNETWIEILRQVASAPGESSPVESAIAVTASLTARNEVHYGLNLGLRLLAAWDPRAFVELMEAPLARAIEEFPKLPEDADPTMSRPVVTGALVLRELTACMLEREVVEALLDAKSKLTRRLAVIALFAHPEVGSERVERGLAAHADPEDIVWALLMPRRDGYVFSEEDRRAMLARLIAQIRESRVKTVLRNAGFGVAKQIGDRLATARPELADQAYAVVHELFEEKLHTGALEHYYVGHAELEHLDLAGSAVRCRSELGAVDLAAHIEAVVKKARHRTRGFFRPRERILHYRSWIGSLRLMQLSALYFVQVCEGLQLSEPQRERLRHLAEELVPFLEASPELDERNDEDAMADGSARARTINPDHALPDVRALQARLAGQA